jgi:hypothetical protein
MRAIQRLVPAAILCALAALVSGCSSHRSSSLSSGAPFAVDPRCRVGSSCLYNGSYEPGERDYAEQEAKRLNEAEYARLVKAMQ